MDRAERLGHWFWRQSKRTKRCLFAAVIVGPWVLFVVTPSPITPWSFIYDLPIAVAAGASVVAFAWKVPLDLVRWERAALTYLTAVNLGLAEFSYAYWSLSKTTASAFSIPLSRTDAAYFTFTLFSTTGFGDITAQGAGPRFVVVLQMALGFAAVTIGLVVLLMSRPTPA